MKKQTVFAVLVAVDMLVCACATLHENKMAPAEYPSHFKYDNTTDTVGIGDQPWRFFYSDSLLQGLIDSGLRRNYDMQVALNNIRVSALQTQQLRWAHVPEVNFNITGSYSNPSENSLNGLSIDMFLGKKHIQNYSSALGIYWEADILGKIKNQKKAAVAEYLQTWEAKRGIQTRLVAAIAQGYYNLLALDKQIDIAERNIELSKTTSNLITMQYKAGDITILGVRQAEAQSSIAQEIVPKMHQARLVQENALSVLVGKLPSNIHRSTNIPTSFGKQLSTGVPASVISRRPDVKSRELEITAADANVKIARAQMYPSFVITAAGGVEALKFTNWFNIPASLFGVAASGITQPVLQRRQLRTRYEINKVNRETAVLRFRQSVLTAIGEVSDALAEIEQLDAAAEIASNRLANLKLAVTNAQLLFQNGKATYLEVIVAQSRLLETELELVNLNRSQLNAVIQLYRALGGGWQ